MGEGGGVSHSACTGVEMGAAGALGFRDRVAAGRQEASGPCPGCCGTTGGTALLAVQYPHLMNLGYCRPAS